MKQEIETGLASDSGRREDASLMVNLQAMMENEKREKAERFRILNAYAKKGAICFAGSSLIEQFPIYELLQDYELPYTIYNRGIGGLTTQEMQKFMDACIYDLAPRAIFINIGTNDLQDPGCTLEDLLGRYDEILSEI